ncbi:ATP-binding protein [Deinococcus sp. UR1]|uniref:ATP-binding protein n=1 Tax=Deinococcus sp. UR1 TaxID=1704277 RepID=UPI000C18EC00|nr:ATP-binding protein [Deinococcus sp. UR1]PIG97083.1 two-component sensor histidine kinase [Deinococcus sp. UR1]
MSTPPLPPLRRLWARLALLLTLTVLLTAVLQITLLSVTALQLSRSLPPEAQRALRAVVSAEITTVRLPLARYFRPAVLTALTLSTLFSLLLAFTVARRFSRPLEDVAATARRIASGDLAARVSLAPRAAGAGVSELGRLICDVNSMAEQLQRTERERRFESAAVAHELRTPITALHARVDCLVDGVYPLTPQEVARLRAPLALLGRLAEDLQTLTVADAGELRLLRAHGDLAALAREVVADFQPLATARSLTLEPQLPLEAPVFLDAARARQVLHNLLDNALRYARTRVTVRLTWEGDWRLEIGDDGPGVTPGSEEQLFGRFYRAEESRARHLGGSGLGLAVARALTEAHGGHISAEPGESGGLRVITRWPAGQQVHNREC